MIIYVTVCFPQVQGAIICICILNCIYMSLIVFNFVFSAILMGVGLNLTAMHLFWFSLCSFVDRILIYAIHIEI